MTFEEVWAELEAKDTTGAYKRAREMAELAIEQLEYAYNNGYEEARKKFERPHGKWEVYGIRQFGAGYDYNYKCSNCGRVFGGQYHFCPECGTDMGGSEG